jgi:SSS family transporter
LSVIDLLIIISYLAAVVAIGFWCRRRQKTTRHYFLAGRQLPWWAISGSIVATETSAITFVSIPGVAYARGGDFTFLQLVFGYLIGRVAICVLFMPAYFRKNLLTIYELLRSRFGGSVRSLAACLFIVMRTVADGVRLLLTSVVMSAVWQVFLPGTNPATAAAISVVTIGGIMLLFTAVGGMEAVVWTEILHVGVYIVGAVAAAVILLHGIPGGFAGAKTIGAQWSKFRVLDFTPTLTRPYVFWAGVIGGAFLNMSTHGTDQYMVQRYLCTTSVRKAQTALLVSGVVILAQFVGFLFIGALLFAYYKPFQLPGYATALAAAPFHSGDQVFPDFIIRHVPSGLSGLLVAAVLAAATSPSVNSIAATALADIYQPLVRGRGDDHYLRVSRLLTIVAGIAQIGVALALQGQTRSAVDTALSVASLINGPILGVFLLGTMRRSGTTGALAGMIAGIAAVAAAWLLTPLAWPWYTVVGSMTTLLVGSLVPAKRAVAALAAGLFLTTCASAPRPPASPLFAEVDATIERAIAEKKIPGGVYHFEQNERIYEKAYGNRALVPAVEPMTADTIFDAASLTKVVATTPSIWLLIERGKIGLDDPITKFIPEFRYPVITIRHLLTHTSGLRPDLDLRDPWSGYDTAMKLILQEEPVNKPGYVFRYSDINFEILGEIVQRVSGQRLDQFAKKNVFDPLGMKETKFLPTANDALRTAPTEPDEHGVMLRGTVHDPTARRMGGVAGHAGLFTTAHDLARYARMLLNGGKPIFKAETVKMLTSVQTPPGVAVKRAGGFDLDSGFSRPRGELYPIGSYGHTGFTGTILWIDPASKSFYVFLSNRVHPNGKGSVTALQVALGTLSARAAGYEKPVIARVRFIVGGDDVSNGIDSLVAKRYAPLRGLRIGLITNQTGIDRSGNPTIDLLRSAPGVTVAALFSPEHGIRGTADESVGDTRDPVSGLPVYSLYGETRKPKPEQLAGLDALVFDIQDIGTRFYTYPATMLLAMEAAAEAKVRFIVLDRVDPIGGAAIEGPLLEGETDFVGWDRVPIRHGMTVGELAQMFKGERHISVDLTVIPLEHWKREWYQDDAGLPWTNTSPNMRSLTEATLYPGIGILERAVSVGRGTATPFELIGAPYIDADKLARELPTLPGIRFEPVHFTPTASVFEGQLCHGVRFTLTDRKAFQPVRTAVALATVLARLYPKDFAVDKLAPLLRDARTLEAIRAGKEASWADDEAAFAARRAMYLLY